MKIELSKNQTSVLDDIMSWYKKPKLQYITLGGYAGTGKTTLLGYLNTLLHKEDKGLKIAYCTYTGKASVILRRKLLETKSLKRSDYIGTIHRLIYKSVLDDEGNIIAWIKIPEEDFQYDVIVVDEASMVPEKIWNDLLSFGKPIIAVGDHGQLPPVEGNFNLMERPMLRLEEIYRQEKDNPIIMVSEIARKYGNIPAIEFSKTVKKIKTDNEDLHEFLTDTFSAYDKDLMVLVGYNNTRIKLNRWIRELLEFDSPNPQAGDRVICLKNNHVEEIFNGMTGTLLAISKEKNKNLEYYDTEIEFDDEDNIYFLNMDIKQFNNPTTILKSNGEDINLFDFGYAFTVHKAQGSQSEKVVLFEERFAQMSDDIWRRWLYTGVTRAVSELYIIGK
ncbi:MAG: ATP-dependent DNA helicase [Candidatus Dojkabacteria bacterium]|jgi:exodeoxyribonuclease-5